MVRTQEEIDFYPTAGTDIEQAAEEAIHRGIPGDRRQTVLCFNGMRISIWDEMTPEDVVAEWDQRMAERIEAQKQARSWEPTPEEDSDPVYEATSASADQELKVHRYDEKTVEHEYLAQSRLHAALQYATQLVVGVASDVELEDGETTSGAVLRVAQKFEAYLRGEPSGG